MSADSLPRTTPSVLVLAGRRGGADVLASHTGASHRALVKVGDVPMLERVVSALFASGLDRLVISSDARDLALEIASLRKATESGRVQWRESAASPAASVLQYLSDPATRLPCVVTTADHALLTSEMVRLFWSAAANTDADLAVAIVKEDLFRTRFPDTQRTFIRLANDSFKAANLFAFLRPAAFAVPSFWRRVEQDRKKPWRLVRAFGVTTLLRYTTGGLTVAHALERVQRTVGARVALVPLPFPEAAIDVDKPEDLDVARDVLAQRATSTARTAI